MNNCYIDGNILDQATLEQLVVLNRGTYVFKGYIERMGTGTADMIRIS